MTDQSIPIINHYIAIVRLKELDESPAYIEEVAEGIINDLDLKVVKKLSHIFYPKGITLAYILSESHFIIHTWPESSMVHIDLFTCSYRSLNEFKSSINSAFSKENIDSVKMKSVDFDKL